MVHRPESRIVRILIARRRLMVSIAAGLILLLVLPASYRTATRCLLAWDLTAAIYVGAVLWMISRSTIETCHARAALYDESDWVIMTLVVASSADNRAGIAIASGQAPIAPCTPIAASARPGFIA